MQAEAYQADARILVVSMEKAYSMVKAGPRQTGCVSLPLWLLLLSLLSFSLMLLLSALLELLHSLFVFQVWC